MSEEDLKTKLQTFDPDRLLKWSSWILTVASSVVVTTFAFCFMNFGGGLSNEHERWGTFGDFIGGMLNPILSFLALIALLLTVVLQSRKAEISINELELSSRELEAGPIKPALQFETALST